MNVSTMNQSQQQQQQQQHHSVQFKWKRKSGNGGHSLVQQQSAITTTMNSVQESNSTKNTTHSKKRTFDCAVLTSNHIILSVYGIESSSTSTLISIHLTNFKIQTLAKWNRLTTTFNLTITDLENEYSQRQVNPPNRLFFDVRPQGSHVHFTCCHLEERELVVAEERDHIISTSNHHSQNLLDLEQSCFEYTVPVMVGTRNLQVDFTCLGSEYWLMSGTEKQKLRTELVHLKSGQKIENSTNPLAMYMVEKDAKLVGLLSVEIYENHEMSFCPLIQNEIGSSSHDSPQNEHGLIPQQVETSTTAVIGIPIWRTKIDDLSKFSYQPNVQNILLQDRLYVVVSGGHGIFLYCLNIQNGNLIWKQCLIESTATSHFSHFDVSCTLKRQVCTNTKGSSICIVGTLEEVAYFLMEFDAESGESRSLERKEYLHGWSNHENLVEQTQQALTRLKIQNDDHSEDDGMTTTHSSLLQHKKCVIC
ncbi:hypothetical protein C9374_001492 [Naegleria lovaniensis]|uniref:Uncharacterized protein n=1 Tax=Naegleria lovaniensis TaxID=51637 RepID=A0AA88KKU6_NAELO|nr:uncharacterized protein C9374_001492 [Naegleria lovaniensis]KAG2387160.1 hypothetical protein C9374_001492 [Naegleria lovaniensis]